MPSSHPARMKRPVKRFIASIAFVCVACGAPGEGHGAEWQFAGSRPEVVASESSETDPPEWVSCVHDEDCVATSAECCCDGRHWSAVHRSHLHSFRADRCAGVAPCDPQCEEPPGAVCESGRCEVDGATSD